MLEERVPWTSNGSATRYHLRRRWSFKRKHLSMPQKAYQEPLSAFDRALSTNNTPMTKWHSCQEMNRVESITTTLHAQHLAGLRRCYWLLKKFTVTCNWDEEILTLSTRPGQLDIPTHYFCTTPLLTGSLSGRGPNDQDADHHREAHEYTECHGTADWSWKCPKKLFSKKKSNGMSEIATSADTLPMRLVDWNRSFHHL